MKNLLRLVCVAFGAVGALALAGAVARAADERMVVPLWPNGAPGFEARKDEPEKVINNRQTNIHNPTLTVFLPPKELATGVGVVIAPGGGHGHLADVHEGYAVGQWLAAHGIAGFVLKYRLARDEAQGGKSPYTVEGHALVDVQRALRLVASRAAEWGVRPGAIGIMGFSAGGELALLSVMRAEAGRADAADTIERQGALPAFAALMYPAGTTRPDMVPTKELPPLFMMGGNDDRLTEPLTAFYLMAKRAGVNAELHVYAGIGHGYGIRDINPASVAGWPLRFREWLVDRKIIVTP